MLHFDRNPRAINLQPHLVAGLVVRIEHLEFDREVAPLILDLNISLRIDRLVVAICK